MENNVVSKKVPILPNKVYWDRSKMSVKKASLLRLMNDLKVLF